MHSSVRGPSSAPLLCLHFQLDKQVGTSCAFHGLQCSHLKSEPSGERVRERGRRIALLRPAAYSAMAAQHAEEDVMSQRDVERTLGRLLTDEGFREEFFLDPARSCLMLGIQLAPHEVEALLRVPRSMLATLGAQLDDRICRLHIQRDRGVKQQQ